MDFQGGYSCPSLAPSRNPWLSGVAESIIRRGVEAGKIPKVLDPWHVLDDDGKQRQVPKETNQVSLSKIQQIIGECPN